MIAAVTPRLSTRRVIIGVALSMLAHVVLLKAWQPAIAPPPMAAPLVLRLQPPAAPAQVVETPVPPTRSKPTTPRRVIAVAPAAPALVAPALVAPALEAPAPAPKKFDLEAARSAARVVGVQDAPNADDAPLGRLKKQQLEDQFQPESKAARAISAAKRGDCKDGSPGGLLAPLIWLTQKAGTGCKW